jgi:hypothetical protein
MEDVAVLWEKEEGIIHYRLNYHLEETCNITYSEAEEGR